MSKSEDILLAKWLENKLNPEELELLEKQYDLESLAKVLERQKSSTLATMPSDKLWEKIDPQLSNHTNKGTKKSTLGLKLRWVFLILLISAVLVYFFKVPGQTIIKAPKGEKKEQMLADGSRVSIAPGSSISFSEKDYLKNRLIQLNGQAFFDVEKGGDFMVTTKNGNVQVLGTEFEIWESGNQMKVHCFEGRVSVGNLTGAQKIIEIKEAVDINNQQMSDVYYHGLQDASFATEQIKYRSIDVGNLATEMERFYNIKVQMQGIDLEKTFTGILVINDVEKAAKYLAETMNWDYELKEENLTYYSK